MSRFNLKKLYRRASFLECSQQKRDGFFYPSREVQYYSEARAHHTQSRKATRSFPGEFHRMYTDVVKVGRAVFADQLSPTNCSHYTQKKKAQKHICM